MTVLAFGIAREILGGLTLEMDLPPGTTTADLRSLLEARFPRLGELRSYLIAVNSEYSIDNQTLMPGDEVAIIPPVSGG